MELTPDQHARAEVDIVYATRLLETAKNQLKAGPSTAIDETNGVSLSDDGSRTFSWTDASTKCFITLYQEYDNALTTGKLSHKKVWDKISQAMHEHGFNAMSKQCSTKLASLKRMYKNIKDHNGKTGNDRKTWQYFELMDTIFAKKHGHH